MAAVGALVLGTLVGVGLPGRSAADPDFPTIPPQPPSETSSPDSETGAAGPTGPKALDDGEHSNALASGQDCIVIKQLISHVDVVLGRQVQVTQAFASKEEGEHAVNQDLDVLNNALPFLVYAESSVQDPEQRAKITLYKSDLGQLSLVIAERQGQDLTTVAPYEWAAKLAEASARTSSDYVKIGNSCLI
ncbi:MAG: hypothetical protein ACRC20_05390 [Segniliparus sp.]|uniref:hypothetical protein n=1 Tax=Segniliparus sp. TaxID=2804064 RepID=UPI003F3F5DDA